MKSRFFSVMCALSLLIALYPARPASGGGRYAGDFLTLGSGAGALGMGSAYVAVSDGAASSYYNPAGLVRLTGREANLMHSEQFGGLENYNSLSLAAPMSTTGAVGVTLLHLGVGDIPVTRLWDPSRALGDSNRVEVAYRTDAADYALFLAGGKRMSGRLAVGAAVKIIHRSIGKDNAFGFGVDLGAQFKLTEALGLGVSLHDVTGTTIAWDVQSTGYDHTSKDMIKTTMDIGAAYSGTLPWVGGVYTAAASIFYFGDSPDVKGIDTMHFGIEYRVGEILVFRGGSSEGSAAFGLGLARLPLIASSSLDYAFLSHAELDSTHRISMSIRF